MWTTLAFSGAAVLFLAMTVAALFHLQWANRLPSLESLAATSPPGSMSKRQARCSVVIAARNEEARIDESS